MVNPARHHIITGISLSNNPGMYYANEILQIQSPRVRRSTRRLGNAPAFTRSNQNTSSTKLLSTDTIIV